MHSEGSSFNRVGHNTAHAEAAHVIRVLRVGRCISCILHCEAEAARGDHSMAASSARDGFLWLVFMVLGDSSFPGQFAFFIVSAAIEEAGRVVALLADFRWSLEKKATYFT